MFNCTRFAEVQHSLLEAKLVASAATTFVLTTAVQHTATKSTNIANYRHGSESWITDPKRERERERERARESERETQHTFGLDAEAR